ncbi:MAG TPA: response regulator [Mariprofundaceae bacterium]|nr:response regulator [Mariprofundaceae bacterium]
MKEDQNQASAAQHTLPLQMEESKAAQQINIDEKTQAFASLGMLTSGIAHDFNNLLSVILGNVSLANKHIESPEQLDIYLSRIEQASKNAAGLCQQMLTYTAGSTMPNQHVHLPTLVEGMARLLEVVLHKHVSIVYDIYQDIPLVCADTIQLQQVIMNLITNANEALQDKKEGTIMLRVQCMPMDGNVLSISGNSIDKGMYVCIEVTDDGCGMNEDTQAAVFTPMFTTKSTGHGLGLSAILAIIRRHSGVIKVSSKLGEGSVFTIAFPALDKQENQDDDMKQEYDALEKFQPNGRILLVDDEEVVLEVMQVMLEDLGYQCILAQNGIEAMERFQCHQDDIEIIIMDLSMPCMGGKACIEKLAQVNSDVKIIVSSGYNKEDVQPQLKDLNIAGFLHKPCSLEQLYATVKSVVSPHVSKADVRCL